MWLDNKYTLLLASLVRNFKRKGNNLYNFSCPYCGDSARDRRKARGYIYQIGRNYRYSCHNCGISKSFPDLLEHLNPNLYKEYQFEKFKEGKPDFQPFQKAKPLDHEQFFVLQSSHISKVARQISSLPVDHDAHRYLVNRKIPFDWFSRLYFSDDLSRFRELFPKYEETEFRKEPRIVIPIYNRLGTMIGITARAIYPSKLRYIMMRNSDEPLIFNLDKIDIGRTVYAFEGAFDSMFVENSVAVDGADFGKLNELVPKDQTVVVFDNQPRNRELIKRIEKVADSGFRMFVWPQGEYRKDFNENIVDGVIGVETMKKLIDDNTYSGMTLKMKLAAWKKLGPNVEKPNYSESY